MALTPRNAILIESGYGGEIVNAYSYLQMFCNVVNNIETPSKSW